MLKPGLKRTHRSFLWAYGTTAFEREQLVVYDFAEGRGGEHARAFLGEWKGALVCDDYQGYDALFRDGVTEVGCLAHARRKFHALHENLQSEIAAEALDLYGALYGVEREAKELDLDAERRRELRQRKARPVADALRAWLEQKLGQVPEGSATAKAILYSLRRWTALSVTSTTANYRSTTTGSKTASGPSRSGATTGCSLAPLALGAAPRSS